MILAVGANSRSGMAEEKLNIEQEETPLQSKLETIANEIGKIGVYVSILTFMAMTIRLIIDNYSSDNKGNRELFRMDNLKKIVSFLIIAITVIVVAVPEGLPLAVTISLAFSVMKMKDENNLVRRLEASETMGGADNICTDKTGTLTKNQMTVREFWTVEKVF
jgi:Ca2+ transporting ATPase